MPPLLALASLLPNNRSYAKGFAIMGALYSFNECVIEKWRAKHDKINPALAGCVTGAMMAHSGEGPSGIGAVRARGQEWAGRGTEEGYRTDHVIVLVTRVGRRGCTIKGQVCGC